MFIRRFFAYCGALLVCAHAYAEPAAQKIAFIDIERTIENSKAIRNAIDDMDDQLAAEAKDIDAQEREFRRARFELDRQLRVLSEEQKTARRDQLTALREEIDRMKFDFELNLRARERQLEPMLEKVYGVIADVAEREGISMVLRGEVVIWGMHTADLTDTVVAELDKNPEVFKELLTLDKAEEPSEAQQPTDSEDTTEKEKEEALPLVP
jgi:outer membrane protein